MSGINHFGHNKALTGYAASKGVPWPRAAVYVSGLFILFGGLGILAGSYTEWSVALIAIFLIIVSFRIHNFWAITDPNMKMGDMVNFLKNMALLGAALMFLALPTPWPFALF